MVPLGRPASISEGRAGHAVRSSVNDRSSADNRSSANVSFLLGEQSAAERIGRRLFGRSLALHEYAGLAGAPDAAAVEVGTLHGMLYLELSDPVMAAYRAYFYIHHDAGRVVLRKEGFHIMLRRLRGAGLGLRVFLRQAQTAARLGIERITAVAGRGHDENGYYTWPRFGFDGNLPSMLRRNVPSHCRGARRVSELMESDEGRRWWREHGVAIRVIFDLTHGSRSLHILQEYAASKNLPPQ